MYTSSLEHTMTISKALLKRIRAATTEKDAMQFLECVLYRYLNKILDKVIEEYNISPQDALILRDRLVNMNQLEVSAEEEEEEPATTE